MNIKVDTFRLDESTDEVEAHVLRTPSGGAASARLAELATAGEALIAVAVDGGVVTFVPGDDVEGHAWRRDRLIEIGNDVVEVSDASGMVRRYLRVGGTPRRADGVAQQYRLGGGPRF